MTSNVFGLEREVYQHGTIGDFIGSTLEGVQSGFIRCVYAAKYNAQNNTVTLLCEKAAGCCLNGCCPKDQFW
ncbi:Protein F26F12.4 [Aphelenchoides avenae]|nr:Protein F26F12.4 [Aphelenchus avenae]